MAERRMFSQTIIDGDLFLDMPLTTQALYFHLSMRADDEGFINSPKKIQRSIGCTDDDLRLLIAKNFVIPFESGIIVIRHWNVHNKIRKDRFKPSIFIEERLCLSVDESGVYCHAENHLSTTCQPNDNQPSALCPHSIGKVRLGKVSLGEISNSENSPNSSRSQKPKFHKHGEYNHVKLSDEQYKKLVADYGEGTVTEYIKRCDEYCQQHGKSYKDYNLTIRQWINKDNTPKASQQVSNLPDYEAKGFWEE